MTFHSPMELGLWSAGYHTNLILKQQLRGGRSAPTLVSRQSISARKLMLKQKSTCHDHRAVNNVNKHSGPLESTGIGATACIHGAFVPDSVVDFQKGEA